MVSFLPSSWETWFTWVADVETNLFAQSVGWVVVQAYPQFEEKYGFSLKHVPSKPRVGPQSNNTSKQYDILITRG